MTRTSHICWLLALTALGACAETSAPIERAAPLPQLDAGSSALADASAPAPRESDATGHLLDAPPTQLEAAVVEPFDAGAEAPAGDASPPDDTQLPITPRTPLLLPERWQIVDAGADPFDDRPAVIDCSTAGVVPELLSEERVLGVDTGWCNYLTAFQPTQRAVQPGEVIKVRLWHFELSAPEPAEAHAALQIGALRVLDERIAIPQAGGLIVKQVTVEQALPAGSPAHFHLHNHGANSWALVEVSAGPR
ncbi:MAG TPA: hypothetical protein VMF89_09565 [Polyangiales bacterium]|nr:hypothetical protein [Polyangiales bacterium]